MDVNSLYTSIGHQDGIKAVMSFLEEHTHFSSQQKSFCRDLLTLILTKNFFIFEDEFFIQEKGTAMGSNMAPPYANIFMDQFEKTLVYSHPSFISFASYWRRYIDDVFLIWTGGSEALEAFHRDLNSSLEGLTFSISFSTSSMNFLDTLVSISSGRRLETDLYVKPTDRNSLLKFDSCHPKHIKVSLPRSQHARVDRIVSKPEVCRMRHQEMDSKFRIRGYPTHVLDTQQHVIRSRDNHSVPLIAFVSTYHPFNYLINSCVTRHWDILGKAYPQVKEFSVKPIISNKRCPNLRDCLIRADVGSSESTDPGNIFEFEMTGGGKGLDMWLEREGRVEDHPEAPGEWDWGYCRKRAEKKAEMADRQCGILVSKEERSGPESTQEEILARMTLYRRMRGCSLTSALSGGTRPFRTAPDSLDSLALHLLRYITILESLRNVGPLPEHCLLVTMDVNSLYTSIGHQDGIKAVMSFLEEHTHFSSQQKSFCRDLLTLILTKNFFIFEDEFFIQEKGTAMGSNMAPPVC
ncbi:unnamed protein product [Ranitomeya imitator]|uniref:Reverse transcriptase domain-containing protein n=1 Tax=Ranitomeya imitator TaxID=111125 RepID=A0ABN9LQL2_9NEOB|nr:unnamed protein product [Ranitomeya imitator]